MGMLYRKITSYIEDYLVDNHQTMSAHPIEVKSGKDYTVHSALNNLLKNPEYNVLAATVISNERRVYQDGKVTYMPVYFVMFMDADTPQIDEEEYFFLACHTVPVPVLPIQQSAQCFRKHLYPSPYSAVCV